MLFRLRALIYALFHKELVHLTVVRRYTDAKQNFIGELYIGDGRSASMIGMSCDNLPFNVGEHASIVKCRLEFKRDFLAPMEQNIVRVGGITPEENEHVRRTVALRQYCPIKVTILNRFIEHVLDSKRHG